MSKAFTRESDNSSDEPVLPPLASPLPPGVKNYMTAGGARILREELNQLVNSERPRFLAMAEAGGSRRDLQILDQRIAYLDNSLRTAVIVEPTSQGDDVVRFGATATVRDRAGMETKYRLVGVDETDVDRGWISWRSPLARALLNTKLGQRVRIQLPSGTEELEIVGIEYTGD